MWNKLSQAAGLAPVEPVDEKEKSEELIDQDQLQHQAVLNQQLKDLVREYEKRFLDKTNEYEELSSKFQKFKLQSKAKISHLSAQIKEQEKPTKKEDCDFDDTSSSDSTDQSRRGKVLLLKKQLEQVKQQLEKKEEESKKLTDGYERKINDLILQLNEKNTLISSLADGEPKEKAVDPSTQEPMKSESNVQEMYAQIVYKDTKIMGLNNQILELEKKIMDLQEHIKEKDEVLQQRNRAVQLMAADLNRKGQTVADELGDTREQMKIMQENFSMAENDWKKEMEKYKSRIAELENDISEYNKKMKNSEMIIKTLESSKTELIIKNAELQKKIVCVQESASKQCELYTKEIEGEMQALKKNLESQKQHSAELQKALDESNTQSNSKVLKARVNERTRSKALERELNELKKANKEKPQEKISFQQRIAELEEEKGSLQLKLIEVEDQVTHLEKLKKENETLRINADQDIIKIQNLGKQIETLEREQQKWEEKCNSLNERYKKFQETHDIINTEKVKMEEDFSEMLLSKKKFENDYIELKKEYSDLKQLYNDSLQNLEKLKDQKIAFELKSIELEEIRENDERVKNELRFEIKQLKESFNNESKPDIQLEKENLELKDKLNDMTKQFSGIEKHAKDLLIMTVDLEKKLSEEKNKYSLEISTLNDKINEMENNNQKILNDLKRNTQECSKQEKSLKELENNFTTIQNELSGVLSYFEAKDVNDCKNYAIKKAEELSNLKNDCEKVIKEKDSLLLNLQGKEEEIQTYALKVSDLASVLQQRDSDLHSFELVIENLKKVVSEKDSQILKIYSELQDKIENEKALLQTVGELKQCLLKSEHDQNILHQELQLSKEALSSYQEKVKTNNSSLLSQISDLENEIYTIRGELNLKTNMIEKLNENLDTLQSQLQLAKGTIQDKDIVIQEKEKNISILKGDVKDANEFLSDLKSQNEALKIEVANKDSETVILSQKVKQCENETKEKDTELSNLSQKLQETMNFLAILEEEKLHSLSEKDEKLHLESNILKIQQENSELNKSLQKEIEKLHNFDTAINEMINLVENDINEDVLSARFSEDQNNLYKLFKKCISVMMNKQTAYQNVSNENSKLQKKIAEMNLVMDKQSDELNKFNSKIHDVKNTLEMYSEKVIVLENDLKLSNDLKLKYEKEIVELQDKFFSLNEENCTLNRNIDSTQEELNSKILLLKNDLVNCQTDLKMATNKIKNYENENQKMNESYKLLENSLANYEVERKQQENEKQSLWEKNLNLENKISELNQLIENHKEMMQLLENGTEQNKLTFLEEKSTLKLLHKNMLSDNKKLSNSIVELESKISEYQESNISFENSIAAFQRLLSEKESEIDNLKCQINVLNANISHMQTICNENKQYKQFIEAKCEYLQICRQHYCIIAKALIKFYAIDTDVSFLETEDLSTRSLDEFTQESKNMVYKCVDRYTSECQSLNTLCNDLKNNVTCYQTSLGNVYSELDSMKACLTKAVEENIILTDSKYNKILSFVKDKENRVEKLKSRISILSDTFITQKNQIISLQFERNINLKELQVTKEKLLESEEIAKKLILEKEMLNKKMEEYTVQISHLNASLKEESRKYNSSVEEMKLMKDDIEKFKQDNQELKNSLNIKDEAISKLQKDIENKGQALIAAHDELQNAHSSISSLQNEIKLLNKQLNECAAESQILETANNVSNGLQVKVEKLKNELACYEEENQSLQQHMHNTDSQMQSLISEKLDIELKMSEMEGRLNNLTEINLNLRNQLEEANASIINYETKCQELREFSNCKMKDFQKLRLEKNNLEGNLLSKISLLEDKYEKFKNVFVGINEHLSDCKTFDYDIISFTSDLQDETLIKLFSELLEHLKKVKSNCVKENEYCLKQIQLLESKNEEISSQLEKIKELHDEKLSEKKTFIPSPDTTQLIDSDLMQQQASVSAVHPADSLLALENEALIKEQQLKFDKVLEKLKIFKIKNERMKKELEDFKNKATECERRLSEYFENEKIMADKILCLENEKKELSLEWQSVIGKKQNEIEKSKNTVRELRQRNSALDEECCKIRQELEEYKHSWNQSTVSFELLKEDHERSKNLVRELTEESNVLKETIFNLSNKFVETNGENERLKQESQNLKEHANMLLSDNDTYQNLIEKLKISKTSLERKLVEAKEKFSVELKTMQSQHELELKQLKSAHPVPADIVTFQKECLSLKNQCIELQQQNGTLQNEQDKYFRNLNLLEKEKLYLQQQLSEKVNELQKTKNKLDEFFKNKIPASASEDSICSYLTTPNYVEGNTNDQDNILKMNELQMQNEDFKAQLKNLVEELNSNKENFFTLKKNSESKEIYYQNKISQLEVQLRRESNNVTSTDKENYDIKKLESELYQAMNSLHKQGLRCEELSLEVSKLLEERNMLKWKLQQFSQMNSGIKQESDANISPSELISIKVETPSSPTEIADLHVRLVESEKICQQLRQANEALDRALINEREQKQLIEEELGYAKGHLSEGARVSDEYQILLGEINEPEMFAETNFSISRNVRTHTYKFRRWLTGRRNYLWRMVKSRNYSQLVYICYLCFIHIWLLMCVLS